MLFNQANMIASEYIPLTGIPSPVASFCSARSTNPISPSSRPPSKSVKVTRQFEKHALAASYIQRAAPFAIHSTLHSNLPVGNVSNSVMTHPCKEYTEQ